MAGFFGLFDYTKPGRGISENEPPKPRIVVFFEIYLRKFWKLGGLNILYFLFNLPAILFSIIFVSNVFLSKTMSANDPNGVGLRLILGFILVSIPVITFGPVQAGFTYVLRNYAREEHAWIWYDFRVQAMKNFKQSMLISFFDLIATIIVGIAINTYAHMGNSIMVVLANAFVIMVFIIFIMMHMYIYPIMVTFNLSIRNIYKNSLLFVMMRFLPTLGIFLICVIIVAVPLFFQVGLLLMPFITLSTVGLITNFFIYPTIKKHMIDTFENQKEIVEFEEK
jgi:uncharacterized membrane protein YesL